jgi:hypothetical protein
MYCMKQSVWPKPGPRQTRGADTRGELLGGCRPCRPRVASPRARGDNSETSWSACQCAALHKSAVRSWRPRLSGGVRTKPETSCPDLQARLSYTAQIRVRHAYATLSRALAGSVCDVCSGQRPRPRHDWPRPRACDWLVLRAFPAGDALAVINSGVQTRLLARPGSDLDSDPCLSVRMPRGVITQWGPGSSRPCRPCTACLWRSDNLFTSSLYLCLVAALHKSVVRSWRPTCLARQCNHAQKNSSAPTNGLVSTTHV